MVRLFSLAALALMLVSVPMATLHAEVPVDGHSTERLTHPPGSKGPKNRSLLVEDTINETRPRPPPPPRPKSIGDKDTQSTGATRNLRQ